MKKLKVAIDGLILICAILLIICLVLVIKISHMSSNYQAISNTQNQTTDEDLDYQVIELFMGAYQICDVYTCSEHTENPYHIADFLWLVPRRYDTVDGTEYMATISVIDKLKSISDESEYYIEFKEEIPVFIRYYMESYIHPAGVNAISHKDVILLQEGNDMICGIQDPNDETSWTFYLVTSYGDWLLKEVEITFRRYYPELF
ncbi:MAG: hypothetical protein LUH07_01795 [Lachnospiraceae bacterium]|nr:hypothetical protein [Lachnospiraceae bacterium]